MWAAPVPFLNVGADDMSVFTLVIKLFTYSLCPLSRVTFHKFKKS